MNINIVLKRVAELISEGTRIFTRLLFKPRRNWESAFETMSQNGDDSLLFDDVFENENLKNGNRLQ